MFRFPFSNYQELNLDWILAKVKEFSELVPGMREVLDKSEQALSDAEAAVTTANEAKEIAEQAVEGLVGPDSVGTTAIKANAVTREKIAAGAVDSSRLAENAVYSVNIANGEIVSNKIKDGAVTTSKIADAAINSNKIIDAQITTAKLADGAVTADKIAPGAIPQATIADGSVTTAKLAGGAVTTAKIDSGAVTMEKLANDSVTGDKIADGSITNAMLASGFQFEKGMEYVNLWNNPASASSFAGQTVQLSENCYNYRYLMLQVTNPNNGTSLFTVMPGSVNSFEAVGGFDSAASPALCYRRTVQCIGTNATFTDCVAKNIGAGTIIDAPEMMIPWNIWGVK